MAYISQEKKSQIAPKVKEILKKYGLKGSLSIHHHSALQLTIKYGEIDFLKNYNENHEKNAWKDPYKSEPAKEAYFQCNLYHLGNSFSGKALKALEELKEAMNEGNFDDSDPQTDYFNVGWYCYIHVGKWNHPYEFTGN
jgi:hypothetical protein